jgi:hypothetical protein
LRPRNRRETTPGCSPTHLAIEPVRNHRRWDRSPGPFLQRPALSFHRPVQSGRRKTQRLVGSTQCDPQQRHRPIRTDQRSDLRRPRVATLRCPKQDHQSPDSAELSLRRSSPQPSAQPVLASPVGPLRERGNQDRPRPSRPARCSKIFATSPNEPQGTRAKRDFDSTPSSLGL